MISTLITATLIVVAHGLWIRRDTWRCRFEVGANLAIAPGGCALVLMSPGASAVIGTNLHHLTGR